MILTWDAYVNIKGKGSSEATDRQINISVLSVMYQLCYSNHRSE